MNYKLNFCALSGFFLISGSVLAGSMGETRIAMGGLFGGIGGSYNSVKVDRYLEAAGLSSVTTSGEPVASGEAGGPSSPFHLTQSTFAPQAQIGYLQDFNDQYSWGLKFGYQYLGISSIEAPVDNFQAGSFVTVSGSDSFSGNYTVKSAQINVNHELSLLAFAGKQLGKFNLYLGAGPVVFETQSHLYGAIGYADINGVHTSITGTPTNFSNTQWMWGGAGQLGIRYQIDPTWFVDINYTYAQTGSYDYTDSAPFVNNTTSGGTTYTTTGTGIMSSSQQVAVQGVGITVNKFFG